MNKIYFWDGYICVILEENEMVKGFIYWLKCFEKNWIFRLIVFYNELFLNIF